MSRQPMVGERRRLVGRKRKAKSVPAPRPTPALKATVTKILNSKTETKYVSQFIQNVTTPANMGYVREVLNSSDANTRLRTILPLVEQGVGPNQRIGIAITPVKFRVTIRYYVDHPNTRGFECHVRQFLLTSKSIRNSTLWSGATIGTQQGNMLDKGDGTNTFPDYGVSKDTWSHTQYPLAKETFTPLPRGNKTFKFGKQAGTPQNAQVAAGAGETPYAPQHALEHTSVVNINCPKLKYEQDGVNYVLPTNFCPLWGACGYVVTSEDNAQYRQLLGEISGGGIGVPSTPLIRYTIFSELWFKDD